MQVNLYKILLKKEKITWYCFIILIINTILNIINIYYFTQCWFKFYPWTTTRKPLKKIELTPNGIWWSQNSKKIDHSVHHGQLQKTSKIPWVFATKDTTPNV